MAVPGLAVASTCRLRLAERVAAPSRVGQPVAQRARRLDNTARSRARALGVVARCCLRPRRYGPPSPVPWCGACARAMAWSSPSGCRAVTQS